MPPICLSLTSPEQYHFIVDLALPAQAQREPRYEEHQVKLAQPITITGRCVSGWQWRVQFEAPFLDASASPDPRLRAFFVPNYSASSNVMRPYQLLKRTPIEC